MTGESRGGGGQASHLMGDNRSCLVHASTLNAWCNDCLDPMGNTGPNLVWSFLSHFLQLARQLCH